MSFSAAFGRLALVLAIFISAPLAAGKSYENHVVRLAASKRTVDRSSPWQFEAVRQESSLAVLVPGGLLLSTAFAVDDAVTL